MTKATKEARAASDGEGVGLVSSVQLAAVRCHEFSARMLKDIDLFECPVINADVAYEIASRIALDEKSFDVRVRAVLNGRRVDTPTEEPLLEIITAYELRYVVVKPDIKASPGDVSGFAHKNAVFNAWPFLRESVYNACVRLGVAPIALGLLRLNDPLFQSSGDK